MEQLDRFNIVPFYHVIDAFHEFFVVFSLLLLSGLGKRGRENDCCVEQLLVQSDSCVVVLPFLIDYIFISRLLPLRFLFHLP